MRIVTLDWRRYGDFSAVGQLTKKIFSFDVRAEVFPVQCLDDGRSCHLFRAEDGGLADLVGRKVLHDAAINRIRQLEPDVIYVRLSIHLGTLELACKLAVALPGVPLVIHYMDKPSLADLSPTRAAYILQIYRFLVKRAAQVCTIHSSSVPWIAEEYGREARVLANFIAGERPGRQDIADWARRPVRIHYFGSIDRKMNAGALAEVCRVVADSDWAQLAIWSNSGIWGDVKEISEASPNITVARSDLDDDAFRARLAEADLLLLPYNMDEASLAFLRHSYSNKFIDYLEAGGVILCLGSDEIPTVQACRDSGLALVFGTSQDLAAAFASRSAFLDRVQALDLSRYDEKVQALKAAQHTSLTAFFDGLAALKPAPAAPVPDWPAGDGLRTRQLGYLIRRKFLDAETGTQSLSASLTGNLLRARGYRGFDYEI